MYRSTSKLLALTLIYALRPKTPSAIRVLRYINPCVMEGSQTVFLLIFLHTSQLLPGSSRRQCLKGLASLTKKVGEIDWYLEFSGLLWVFLGFCD